MTKRSHLGEFEILVLAALLQLGEEAYGVPVRREIERRSGRSVTVGAVYTTLHRLEKKGLVSSRTGPPSPVRGGRARRYFTIEAAGRRDLERSLATLRRMVDGLEPGWESGPA